MTNGDPETYEPEIKEPEPNEPEPSEPEPSPEESLNVNEGENMTGKKETPEREAPEFEIGDPVVITVNNVKVHGVVESIQLKANLVDVKIYEPGHTSHCLIVARPPEEVDHDSKSKAKSA